MVSPLLRLNGFAHLQGGDEAEEMRDEGLNMGDIHTRRNDEREIRVLTMTKKNDSQKNMNE